MAAWRAAPRCMHLAERRAFCPFAQATARVLVDLRAPNQTGFALCVHVWLERECAERESDCQSDAAYVARMFAAVSVK